MASLATAKKKGDAIVRPLSVLAPSIERHLKEAEQAAYRAQLPHFIAAGDELLEAKGQLQHGQFMAWVQKHFKISTATASRYMRMAKHVKVIKLDKFKSQYESVVDFERKTSKPRRRRSRLPSDATASAASHSTTTATTVDVSEEHKAKRELGLQIIAIGYKTLAAKQHPDAGGSGEAMARLNGVRDSLRQACLNLWYVGLE